MTAEPTISWLADPGSNLRTERGTVAFRAGAETDWFCDPRGAEPTANAPIAVLTEAELPITVSCAVDVTLATTFDAAGLFVHWDDRSWVKLAIELDPSGIARIVTVLTDGTSDDCNHRPVDGPTELRVTVDERSLALHARHTKAVPWELIRYAANPTGAAPSVGLTVQSPLGDGTDATFSSVLVERRVVEPLRDGS